MEKEKIIIFGASKLGRVAYNFLQKIYDIAFWCDNDPIKWNNLLHQTQIIPPSELLKYGEFKIIIASMYCSEISEQLFSMGIRNIKVFICDNIKSERYILENIYDKSIFMNIKLDNTFKENFIKDFSLLYNNKHKLVAKNNPMLNKNERKKVLIISYIFPPIAGGGVQRTLKFVKYLRDFGWEPIVVTVGEAQCNTINDSTLLDDVPNDIKIIRIDHKFYTPESMDETFTQQIINIYYGIVNNKILMEKFFDELKSKNRRLMSIPDNCISWVNLVLSEIELKINIEGIDAIYTTSAPYSAHIIGFYLKKKYSKPWIVDFRDEWTNNPYMGCLYDKKSIRFTFERIMEKAIIDNANKVITVSPESKKNYIDIFNIYDNKVHVITNGYDEEDFRDLDVTESEKDRTSFSMIFIGSMYLEIRPDSIIMAINNLCNSGRINKAHFIFYIVGSISAEIEEYIIKNDYENVITIIPYTTHKESLIYASKAQLLVAIIGDGAEKKGVYTGKIFEYLRLNKPILALSPKGSVVEELLIRTNSGKNIEYNNVYEIENYIYRIYKNIVCCSNKYCSNNMEIIKYERKNLTKELTQIFNYISGKE